MIYSYTGADPYGRQVPVPVVAGEGLGGDTMQIRYSINNPTRTNATPHLRKPLIYVEGYDVSGKYNILNLISNDQNNIGEWNELLNRTGYDFMHYLDDIAGYDLVFVNYNTLRSFVDNSKMLQHVIAWIKQDKTAGGYTTQNVIIGTSAGGVLARYTLARMTKTISSASTDTRLLITHDSPHQGASVPLAFQHFLYDLGNVKILGNKIKDNLEDLKNFYVLNTLPATAELLRARVVDENGTVLFNTFLNGPGSPYQQMITFPTTGNQPIYRFIATAQGSQCGVPVMSSNGLSLADYDGDFAFVRFKYLFIPTPGKTKYFLKTQLWALPSSGTQSQIEYFRYSRRFSYFGIGFGTKTLKEVSRSNPTGFTSWDAAPGSTQSINDRTGGALNTGLTKQKVPWYATPFLRIKAGLNLNITQDLFSFVNTTSALDAPPGTPLNMTYLYQSTGTSGTSSQKYIAQERFTSGSVAYYNQNHTDFTARNSRWIYNEMETITQPIDCNDYCDISTLQINGNSSFCITSGTYTVDNLSPNSTVTWSASPSGIVTITPNGNSVVLTKQSNGIITLSANILSSCGNVIITKQNIVIGAPVITNIAYSMNGGCNGTYQTWSLAATANIAVSSWLWTVDNPGSGGWYIYNPNSPTTFVDVSGGGGISVTATNSCGTSKSGVTIWSNCHYGAITASPNPTTDNVTVATAPTTNTAKTANSKPSMIYALKVIDENGTLRKQYKYAAGVTNVTISMSGLISGAYTIQAYDGAVWNSVKVIKQ